MKKIAVAVKSATRGEGDLTTVESSETFLRETFSQKKFLLVLDDVWNENQGMWEELKVLFKDGMKGSKILVTTRSEKVAEIMKTTEQPHRPKGLSNDDCWTLFKRRAFKEGEENNYPSLVNIGKQIVEKCGGVPLAANALGSMMRFKRMENEWTAIKDSKLWELEDKEILPSLKLSYIQMPLSALKRCFAYCSIFPKGYEIDKDDLIQQWFALGFISSPDASTLMEHTGNAYFNELLWGYFLQEVEDSKKFNGKVTYRMHDLMHDLARSVAREEVAVIVGEGSTKIPEGCRYASIYGQSVPHFSNTEMRRLRALRFRESASLVTFYSEAKCLRLLNLQYYKFSMLPSSIGKLKLLRYLNLLSTSIQELPESITSLCNLQTLNLSGCHEIHTLPKFLGRLENLRILNLSNCSRLLSLPSSLCQLKNLHDLNLSYLRDLEALPESIGNLENLRFLDLRECSSLLSLPSSSSELRQLEKLDISHCKQLCELPKMIENLTKLRELLNKDCLELKAMPRGIGKLVSLPELSLFVIGKQDRVEHCASISELERLKLVGELEIKGLENVTNPVDAMAANLIEKNLRSLKLKWNVLSAAEDMDTAQPAEEIDVVLENLQPHQNLAKLVIKGYAGGKFPSWMMNRIDSWLPNLVKIKLVNIPRCRSLPPLGLLPVLKKLIIGDMPVITNLGVEFYGDSHINESANKFPALRRLELSDMPVLREWVTQRRNKFPALVELSLKRMPMLREWVPVDDEEGKREPVPIFPCLTHLTLEKCGLASVESLRSLTALRNLTIRNQADLEIIEDGLGELTELQTLDIDGCSSLRYLPVQKMATLTELYIKDCPLLFNAGGDVRVNERSEPCLPTSVEDPTIFGISKEVPSLILKHPTMNNERPPDDGDAVSFQQPNMGLRYLRIENCQQLTCLPEEVRSLTSLKSLSISDCGDLEIIEDWLGELTKLQSLSIFGCSSLRYFPVHKMTTLTELSIKDCPLLFNAGGDVRVNERPEPGLPTSVQELTITEMSKEFLSLILKRPTMDSETPPDNGDTISLQQPNTRLKNLTIENCQQLTCLPEELRSLTSLERVSIWDCPDLESIEDWLGELSKLNYLHIYDCQSLRYLPAHKMTTLEHLSIKYCPLLFNADGQFVDTNVDHITYVQVNGRKYLPQEEKKSWTRCWR